jgi:predicted alpha/beta-hydrolase family hydrolase
MAEPLLLFAHGAGVPSSHPWMQGWADRLSQVGEVTLFDYPYARAGRKSPDRLERLVDAHRQALLELRGRSRRPVVLVGKSLGARVGCHLALAEPVAALVCFGYPLRGTTQRAELRDQVLQQLRAPILFVQGSRDSLCPIAVLQRVRKKMPAYNELFLVEGGNHSLQVAAAVLRAAGETQAEVDHRILATVRNFLTRVLGGN